MIHSNFLFFFCTKNESLQPSSNNSLKKNIRKMSIPSSSKSVTSPREKRFSFFRTRHLSAPSETSSSSSSSPKLSPRTLFDKVKNKLVPSSSNNNTSYGPSCGSTRKRLSHSISEERDEESEMHNESHYRTFHGLPSNLKTKLNHKTQQQQQEASCLTQNLRNLHVDNNPKVNIKLFQNEYQNKRMFIFFKGFFFKQY